jgi:hypothetical protein
VRGVVGVAHDRVARSARVGIALVDRERRRVEARGVDGAAVRRDRERGRAEVALALRLDEAQLAGLASRANAPSESSSRPATYTDCPSALTDHRHRAAEPAHAADAVAHHRGEAQRARLAHRGCEHRERVGVEARHVDVGAVRRDRESPGWSSPSTRATTPPRARRRPVAARRCRRRARRSRPRSRRCPRRRRCAPSGEIAIALGSSIPETPATPSRTASA